MALLERIIHVSSNPGDVVLDPFCGCGTAIAAAHKRDRCWIGIDITCLATNLIKRRLRDSYGDAVRYTVIGEPVTVSEAEELARSDPYQFQWWILGRVNAISADRKKGADRGIDGRLYFHDDLRREKTKQIVLSVKAGHTGPDHVRDLRGVIEREQAEIGVLLMLQEPTRAMRVEAASAGYYSSPGWGRQYPRLQILTVPEILAGKRIDYPADSQVNVTYLRAPKHKDKAPKPLPLPLPAD